MKEITIDLRKVSKSFMVSVQYKNMWTVKLGLFLLKLGCYIGGFSFVDEFPMSLIQSEKKEKFVDKELNNGIIKNHR